MSVTTSAPETTTPIPPKITIRLKKRPSDPKVCSPSPSPNRSMDAENKTSLKINKLNRNQRKKRRIRALLNNSNAPATSNSNSQSQPVNTTNNQQPTIDLLTQQVPKNPNFCYFCSAPLSQDLLLQAVHTKTCATNYLDHHGKPSPPVLLETKSVEPQVKKPAAKKRKQGEPCEGGGAECVTSTGKQKSPIVVLGNKKFIPFCKITHMKDMKLKDAMKKRCEDELALLTGEHLLGKEFDCYMGVMGRSAKKTEYCVKKCSEWISITMRSHASLTKGISKRHNFCSVQCLMLYLHNESVEHFEKSFK